MRLIEAAARYLFNQRSMVTLTTSMTTATLTSNTGGFMLTKGATLQPTMHTNTREIVGNLRKTRRRVRTCTYHRIISSVLPVYVREAVYDR